MRGKVSIIFYCIGYGGWKNGRNHGRFLVWGEALRGMTVFFDEVEKMVPVGNKLEKKKCHQRLNKYLMIMAHLAEM